MITAAAARRRVCFSGDLFDVKYLNNITNAPAIKAAVVCGLFHIIPGPALSPEAPSGFERARGRLADLGSSCAHDL